MLGTLVLLGLGPLSPAFYGVYALTGVTDALDGWVARKTGTASPLGARLDSCADLLFYAVMIGKLFPVLYEVLPQAIWLAVLAILWFACTAQPTAIHYWFQYRSIALTHWAVGAYVTQTFWQGNRELAPQRGLCAKMRK